MTALSAAVGWLLAALTALCLAAFGTPLAVARPRAERALPAVAAAAGSVAARARGPPAGGGCPADQCPAAP